MEMLGIWYVCWVIKISKNLFREGKNDTKSSTDSCCWWTKVLKHKHTGVCSCFTSSQWVINKITYGNSQLLFIKKKKMYIYTLFFLPFKKNRTLKPSRHSSRSKYKTSIVHTCLLSSAAGRVYQLLTASQCWSNCMQAVKATMHAQLSLLFNSISIVLQRTTHSNVMCVSWDPTQLNTSLITQ